MNDDKIEEESRDDVMKKREQKKLEKQLRKQAALAKKSGTPAPTTAAPDAKSAADVKETTKTESTTVATNEPPSPPQPLEQPKPEDVMNKREQKKLEKQQRKLAALAKQSDNKPKPDITGNIERVKPLNFNEIPPTNAEKKQNQNQQKKKPQQNGNNNLNKNNNNSNNNNNNNNKKIRKESQDYDKSKMNNNNNNNNSNNKEENKNVLLFSHLPLAKKCSNDLFKISYFGHGSEYFFHLFNLFSSGKLHGTNTRCLAMLDAVLLMIETFTVPETPSSIDSLTFNRTKSLLSFSRALDNELKYNFRLLMESRPLSYSLRNIIGDIRSMLQKINTNLSTEECKQQIKSEIKDYKKKINNMIKDVSEKAKKKIQNNDVIVTYSKSNTVINTFISAKKDGIKFKVIVVDSPPYFYGKITLQKLTNADIDCSYCYLNGLSYVIKTCTKIILPTASLLSNGSALSQAGTASIAMLGSYYHIPVLFLCETYKFTSKIKLDSICENELGDRNVNDKNNEMNDIDHLKMLSIRYDVTPAQYISVIISEIQMLPPSSVPVVVREQKGEEVEY